MAKATSSDNDAKKKEGPGKDNRSFLSLLNPFRDNVGLNEKLLFTKYFATLTKAGISVLRSLGTLSRQMKSWIFRKMIWEMKEEVEGGIPLNICFKKNNDTFGMLYSNLIRVGEESGRLFLVLDRLSNLLERQIMIRRKVVGAMTYPAIITFVATCVVLFLMIVVIPQFAKLFSQFGQQLPWLTQVVIDISNFIGRNVLLLIAGAIGSVIAIYQINASVRGRRFFDWIKLKVPVLGNLYQKYLVALYSRNLATLFQSGVNIISAMKISNEAIENVILAEQLGYVVNEVEGGIPIAKALAK